MRARRRTSTANEGDSGQGAVAGTVDVGGTAGDAGPVAGVEPVGGREDPGHGEPSAAVEPVEGREEPGDGDGGEGPAQPTACNEVLLVGRLSAPVEERTLPSGDVLATWRLVVDRPPARRPHREGARPVTVDTLDCVAWTGRLRQCARRLRPGDVVRVEGALRRRFWRAGAGAASRCEVEVTTVERLSRPAPSG